MDVHKPRERIFSILNDNDCASFTIKRTKASSPPAPVRPSICPIQERPGLSRQSQFSKRNSSISSSSSPPLLRFDSSSSKSSSSTMDSSPSPLTPAYSYNDGSLSYDNLLRQDLGFLPSPTTITPFMEQQMMINAAMVDPFQQQYPNKSMSALAPANFPLVPMQHSEVQPIHPPSLTSDTSVSTSLSNASAATKPSPTNTATSNPPAQKKNKYPCPYATSHGCLATFTTSGHAARHGKKHTGEKGVHCPVCNKAFTRKDNMKQHERTHKAGSSVSASSTNSNSDDPTAARRSKAAITKDAQKAKSKNSDVSASQQTRSSSIIHSPLSEVTSLAPTVVGTPMNTLDSEPMLYPNPETSGVAMPQMLLPEQSAVLQNSGSLYPPLGDDTMLSGNPLVAASMAPLPPLLDKQDPTAVMQGLNINTAPALPPLNMPPGLVRGFSDLDTLAQAAESFDPGYYGQPM